MGGIGSTNIGVNNNNNSTTGSFRDKRKSSSLYRIGLSRNNRSAKATISSQSVPSSPISSVPPNFQNLSSAKTGSTIKFRLKIDD